MTCFHPLLRYETYEKYRCLDGHLAYKASVVKLDPGQRYEDNEKLQEYLDSRGFNVSKIRKTQIIPCGKCIGCRLEYSKDWATKAMFEASQFKDNWFLTITYDNEHLPVAGHMIDPNTGEDKGINPYGSLEPEDLTNFIKRLRIEYERKKGHKGIRFMACGEYGDQGHRPHYHGIFFNLPIPLTEMVFHEYNANFEPMWRCTEIERIWGKGMVVAAQVNWNTCAYVARYVTKKVGLPTQEEYYKCLGVKPEFFRMSRKPGIGRKYFEEHADEIYKKDEVLIHKYGGGTMKVKPPKYYDKLYDVFNHEKMEEVKKERKKVVKAVNKLNYSHTTSTKKEQLEIQERTKKGKASSLRRDKV